MKLKHVVINVEVQSAGVLRNHGLVDLRIQRGYGVGVEKDLTTTLRFTIYLRTKLRLMP